MKIRNNIVLFCLISVLSVANVNAIFEGGWGSGGGKAVVCFDSPKIAEIVKKAEGVISSQYLSNITYMETLDLFHAQNVAGEALLHRVVANESYVEFLDRMIQKIQIADPFFAREIIKSKNEFNKRIIGFKHGPVDPTHDENYSEFQFVDQCVLTNVAVQKWDEGANGYRLHIDTRLFNHIRFSEESKATLMLHEYLYQVAREKGERDSKSTRDLISAVLTDNPEINLKDYITEFGF